MAGSRAEASLSASLTNLSGNTRSCARLRAYSVTALRMRGATRRKRKSYAGALRSHCPLTQSPGGRPTPAAYSVRLSQPGLPSERLLSYEPFPQRRGLVCVTKVMLCTLTRHGTFRRQEEMTR
jgi:hypothetical protein